jgi:type II secretory pathway component HofQ
MVADYFKAAGVDFTVPGKSVLFNDRLNEFLVRGTLSDLDVVQQAVETLNQAPPQVMVAAEFVEMDEAAAKSLGMDWIQTRREFSKVLTRAQYKSALAALQRQSVAILAAPKVITQSGRQARVSISDPGSEVALDIIPTVNPDGYTIRAVVIPTVKKGGQTWQIAGKRDVFDGDALVLGKPITNSPPGSGMRMVFVTPRIIDATGHPVHSDDQISNKVKP